MSTSDTARSLLQFFGTWLEWGQRGTLGIHDASPELMALTMAILDVVPAAWQSYGKGRDDGWVDIFQPHPDASLADAGFTQRHVAVHNVPRPPRWVAPDGAHASHVTVIKATVAALVGLASMPDIVDVAMDALRAEAGMPLKYGGCARVMATLTDEDIAKAERSDRHDANDSIGGE